MKNSVDILNLRLFSFFSLNYVSWRKGLWQSFESEMKNAVWVFALCFFLTLFMISIYVALLTFTYLIFQTLLSIVLLVNLYAVTCNSNAFCCLGFSEWTCSGIRLCPCHSFLGSLI